nr:MAG TPA: hypothetical protein [Caudoviricetes sp.]
MDARQSQCLHNIKRHTIINSDTNGKKFVSFI